MTRRLETQDALYRLLDPYIPSWITANMLTELRMMASVLVLLLLTHDRVLAALALFAAAALTDALDGSLARVRGQSSRWGRILDPLADKLLLLLPFLYLGTALSPFALLIAVLFMEFITVFASLAFPLLYNYLYPRSIIIQANTYGKYKIALYYVGLGLLFVAQYSTTLQNLASVCFIAGLVMAGLSFTTALLKTGSARP